MRFCKKCVMPDTRPGITFDENGICIACQHAMKKKTVNWDERHKELENLCDKYRRKGGGNMIASLPFPVEKTVIAKFTP